VVVGRAAPVAEFFGIPVETRALELVEPTARRTIGYIMADRDPPSPIARNLWRCRLPRTSGR